MKMKEIGLRGDPFSLLICQCFVPCDTLFCTKFEMDKEISTLDNETAALALSKLYESMLDPFKPTQMTN